MSADRWSPGPLSAVRGTMIAVAPPPPEVLVGREPELARLLDFCAGLSDGAGTVILAAEAGGGKTSLVQALAAHDAAPPSVVAECIPLGGEGLPFVPVSSILRQLVDCHGAEAVRGWAGPGADTLGLLAPELGSPEGAPDRLRLFEAVGQVLRGAAAGGSLLVVIEDLHWSDEATRDLVGFLVRTLGPAPVGLVLTHRSDEVHRGHPLRPFLAELGRAGRVERMELPRLDRTQVGELLELLVGEEVDPELAATVHERTEGLPFFAAELGVALANGCDALPDDLVDMMLVRVAPLSTAAQQLVRLMTTAGNSISHPLLAAVVGDDTDLDASLREAVDAGILHTTDGGYRFHHAVLREALHADLLPGEHARAHVRFAEALLAHPELAQNRLDSELAHHWAAANEQQLAFASALEAARTSTSPYEQIRMYERVLELWDQVDHSALDGADVAGGAEPVQPPTRADVLEATAMACRRVAASVRGLPYIRAALDETDAGTDPLGAARRLVIKATLQGLLADASASVREMAAAESAEVPDSIRTVRRALELTEPHPDSVERCAALDTAATQLMLSGLFEEARTTALEACAAAERLGDRHLLASGHNTLGCTLILLGSEEEGLAEVRAAEPLTRGDMYQELRHHVNYSDALTLTARPAEAVEVALAGARASVRYGLARAGGAMSSGNAVEALLDLGELDRAEAVLRDTLQLLPEGHNRLHLGVLQACVDVWRGRYDQVTKRLRALSGRASPAERLPQYELLRLRAHAELAWWTGQPAVAWPGLRRLIDQEAQLGRPRRLLALHLAARAVPAEETAAIARIRELIDDGGPQTALSAPYRALVAAELEGTVDTWGAATEAVTTTAGTPVPLIPYARARWAARLVESGDRAGAEGELAHAAEEAARIGLVPLQERIATLRRRIGTGSASSDGAGQESGGPLTPRERQVLGLVAEGRSNAEVGRELYISAKTVSVHVSNLMAKLGASSRGDAVARARRTGLLD